MSGKNIIVDDKQINKSSFYKIKKLFKIYDIDATKILISKTDSFDKKKTHLNTFLDIMMMMLFKLYVSSFVKLLGILNILIVIRQCLVRLKDC